MGLGSACTTQEDDVRYADFPFGMRVVLTWGVLFVFFNALLFSTGIVGIAALLSDKGINPAAAAIVGAMLAFAGSTFIASNSLGRAICW
jgi:hypothetical protein